MIHIIHSLGGCGGTVLSRCIGVLPGVALLSEINPASVKLFSQFDPLYQDKNWLRLLGPADTERFSQMDLGKVEAFRELVDVFHIRAIEANRHLTLRDYNFVDFVGVPFTAEPPRRLALYAALPAGVPTRAVAFIRHPVDQWSSLCKHEIVRAVLSPSVFCEAYAAFLEELGSTKAYKYEDFVDRPETVKITFLLVHVLGSRSNPLRHRPTPRGARHALRNLERKSWKTVFLGSQPFRFGKSLRGVY